MTNMLVVHSFDQLPSFPGHLFVAIGVFDGVHLGHQAILRDLIQRASRNGGEAVLLTFQPHPQKVISPVDALPLLQTPEQKLAVLDSHGVRNVVQLPFTRELSLLSPDEFGDRILRQAPIAEIHVGSNFRFGHRRAGDLSSLRRLGQKFGFIVCETQPVLFRKERVSSTKIRLSLMAGRVGLAHRLLGRPYEIGGTVVAGDSQGTRLGFPTANLSPLNELVPLTGVYVTRSNISGDEWIPSVTNIGFRPTFHHDRPSTPLVETHLLNFSGDLYGRRMNLQFLWRIRAERRFSGVQELRDRIAHDTRLAEDYFRRTERFDL